MEDYTDKKLQPWLECMNEHGLLGLLSLVYNDSLLMLKFNLS